MESIAIVSAILLMFALSNLMAEEALENIMDPLTYSLNQELRKTASKIQQDIIPQKITQQNQVLENLLLMNLENNALMKKLIKHCDRLERPENHDRVEVFLPNRRSNTPITLEEKEDTPIISILRFGKNMRRYGRLFADVISNEVQNQLDPILEVISATDVSAV